MAKDQIALLYSAFSVMDAVGGLVGSPVIALADSAGLRLGGVWESLPFSSRLGRMLLPGLGFGSWVRLEEGRVVGERTKVRSENRSGVVVVYSLISLVKGGVWEGLGGSTPFEICFQDSTYCEEQQFVYLGGF